MIIMKVVPHPRVGLRIAAVAVGVAVLVSVWLFTRSAPLIALVVAVAVRLMWQATQALAAQRVRPLATVRAIGATRGQVARAVLLEAGVVGVTGSLLGAGAGWLAAGHLPGSAETLLLGIVAGTVPTMLVAYLSVRQVIRWSPAAVLRPATPALPTAIRREITAA